ncbi:MAG TPA: hypothetical protein VFQ91_26565 [Bryobacteraceae bacterium]|nr:hypothetical protein [Bryobacteraceae bacterium]
MAKKHVVDWHKVDQPFTGLETNVAHEIEVRREAIPLIFVPGIMGTHLRRPGTDGKGEANGLPNLRWNPSELGWTWDNLIGMDAEWRRRLIVGEPDEDFRPDYLEPDEDTPPGNGFRGIMTDYHKFLTPLRTQDWGEFKKIFEFPVYACGYNWTADVRDAAAALLQRIDAIIEEGRAVTGFCEKVILISHSMGGLVCRTASEVLNGRGKIIGIVHGVQPVNGAPAAYWRMKAGFEGFDKLGLVQSALGNTGEKVTAILGNIPGGLELLPNKLHKANDGKPQWLKVTEDGKDLFALPNADPYEEIYRVKAEVRPKKGEKPSTNRYWGLVDPDLLNPARNAPQGGNEWDDVNAAKYDPWKTYLDVLRTAESLHDALSPPAGPRQHPQTLCITGNGHKTADIIELQVESNWVRSDPYPRGCFRGFFTNAMGKDMQAVLQDPAGEGDATVVLSSGIAVEAPGRPKPGDKRTNVEHQPAYEDAVVQAWSIEAIKALCKHHFHVRRGTAPSEDQPPGGPPVSE